MDTIRIGIIGTGSIMQGHLARLLSMPQVEIIALCDISDAALSKTQAGHEGRLVSIPIYTDHQQMLDTQRPDAVVIATPHTQHFAQTMDALSSGAHVLLEKPMVTQVHDARVLLQTIETMPGRIVALSYQRHTMPQFRFVRDAIQSGQYGKVQSFSALQQQGWARGTIGTWRQDPALSGGGQINDSGSHLLDIVLWTTGVNPQRVSAFMDNRGTPVDINSIVNVQCADGAQGNFTITGDSAGWYEDTTLWCDRGVFYLRNDGTLTVQRPDGTRYHPEPASLPDPSDPDTNFINALRGTQPLAATPLDGLRVALLTDAAWRSAALSGAPVPVEPA